jgi:ABC-2 type transport system ATP-binding protein
MNRETTAPQAIVLEGVTKHYRHFDLGPIDLALPQGQITGLIGANGAGKSTTLRILMGLVLPDRGRVDVLGHPIPRQQREAKAEIGFVSEDLRLYKAGTLRWHMDFVRAMFPRWDEDYAVALLRRFDLEARQKIHGLSHGQRVKAAILLALARRPKLLVLDEPTTGLDPVARHEVLRELTQVLLDEDRSVLFSSHNTLDVEQISDRIVFLDRGRVVADDDKESYLERWRRLRIELPVGVTLPDLADARVVGGNGRLAVIETGRYDADLTAAVVAAGGAVTAVEPMTLEEIFVSSVQEGRKEKAA